MKTLEPPVSPSPFMDQEFDIPEPSEIADPRTIEIIEQGTAEHTGRSQNPVLVQFRDGELEGPILERSKYHLLSPPDYSSGAMLPSTEEQ
jgi:hypothetical protein